LELTSLMRVDGAIVAPRSADRDPYTSSEGTTLRFAQLPTGRVGE
jgi:hypothetical protein